MKAHARRVASRKQLVRGKAPLQSAPGLPTGDGSGNGGCGARRLVFCISNITRGLLFPSPWCEIFHAGEVFQFFSCVPG